MKVGVIVVLPLPFGYQLPFISESIPGYTRKFLVSTLLDATGIAPMLQLLSTIHSPVSLSTH